MRITILGSGSPNSPLAFRPIDIAKQLADHGHAVTIILPSADKYNHFKSDKSAQIQGVKLIQPWQLQTTSAFKNLLPYIFSSLPNIFKSRPNLIYISKPTPITILGLLPKLLLRIPVVIDMDDLGSEVMAAEGQSSLQVKVVAACEHIALRLASAVVVTSSFLESIVHDKYQDKPILLIPNGINIADYPAVTVKPLRSHIYYFGMLNRISLIEPLLRAVPRIVAAIPDTKFTIIGAGTALDEAKALTADIKMSGKVNFTGWQSQTDSRTFTQFGDLAICYQPNTRTVRAASNMKVFQYMAMGTLPVVSKVGDLPIYVESNRAGAVVAADDASALADTIIGLLNDPTERIARTLRARQTVEDNYTWLHLGNKINNFLGLLSSKQGKS